jgi:peptidoglycan/LPS O-acetylase OafA/YrhL
VSSSLPPPPAEVPRPVDKLYGIELLRFGAALAVLFAHYCQFFIYGLVPENFTLTAQPLFDVFRPFYMYGTRAVEVFWCLSGFIFFHQYGRTISQRTITVRRFFWLRFARLYPLHILTLLAVVLLQWVYHAQHGSYFVVALNDLKHFVLNLLFASHWGLQGGFSFNAPVWSVSLEILVYAFFFAASWFLRLDYFMTVFWLVGCVVLNHFLGYEGVFVRCLYYFYTGGLSCLCYQSLGALLPRFRFLVAAGAAILLALCLYRFRVTADLDMWLLNTGTPVALLLAALVSPLFTGRAAGLAGLLGNLTYSSYLIHFPLQLTIMLALGLAGVRHDFAYSPWVLASYLVVILLLSRFVFLRVELPAQTYLRRRFAPPV